MTARRLDTPTQTTFRGRTLGLLAVLAVAAAAYLAAPGSAIATPISYTLSGVTATFPAFPRTYDHRDLHLRRLRQHGIRSNDNNHRNRLLTMRYRSTTTLHHLI
jgi:hypothetical protein